MRNKKIISLVCALTMIFSMFSAFTVVNAEGAKGIKLEGSLSKDLKEVTIVATAQNVSGGLQNASVSFEVPAGVTEDDITYTADKGFAMVLGGLDGTTYTLALVDTSGKGVTPTAELATIKINFDTPLADNFVVVLGPKAGFEDADGAVSVEDDMEATKLEITNPNVKPNKADRPGENTDEDPVTPDKPKPVQPGASDKGIKLEASLDKTNTNLTLKATAQNVSGGLQNASVSFEVPAGVTEEDITYTADKGFAMVLGGLDGTIYTLALVDTSGKGVTPTAELATITIKLPAPATDDVAITLGPKAGFEDADGAVSVEDKMTATTVVAEPAGASKPTGNTVALKDYVHKDGPAAATAAKEAKKTVYMTIKVTDKDGNDADYGRDYVAEYPAGKQLTKKEYENLIHGYTDADMADVISNLKFVVYNSDKAYKISTTLNTVEDDKQLVDPVEDKVIGGPEKTQAASVAKMTLKASSTSINVNSITRVTATVTDATDATEVGENVKFKVTSGGNYLEFVEKTDADGFITEALKDGAATVKVNATEKTGTAKVTAYYTYKDKNGEEKRIDQTVTITVKKQTTGSSSDTDGKGGAISQGVGIIGAQTGTINFVDLDTVTWAQDAILRLVDKQVINGRSNTIFDPNGTVTRAEFAKMVVLGFGLAGGTAGNFSDVDTSAWYNTYVQIGYANDVISGYDDGTFRPNGLISRQEMAAMISRAVKAANKNLPATVAAVDFTDVNPTTEWGYAEISALQTAGVINGMTATTYEPYSNATRAQAAVIIDRAMANAK